VSHWKAEKEVRRRSVLPRAGGYMGTGRPMLGTAEQALMVYCADEARKGTPVSEDLLPALLRDTAIRLKVRIPNSGQMYTNDTKPSSLVNGFIKRSGEKGIPFMRQRPPFRVHAAAQIEQESSYPRRSTSRYCGQTARARRRRQKRRQRSERTRQRHLRRSGFLKFARLRSP